MKQYNLHQVEEFSASYRFLEVPEDLLWMEQTPENLNNLGWWIVQKKFNGRSVLLSPQQFLVFESTVMRLQRISHYGLSENSAECQRGMKGLNWFAENYQMEYSALLDGSSSGSREFRLAA